MKAAMLSRVASSLFWMGRYLERAEQMARQLDVSRYILVDLAEPDPEGARAERQATAASLCVPDLPLDRLLFEAPERSSVADCLNQARENARQVREVITREMWEWVNQTHWSLRERARDSGDETVITKTLEDVLATCATWDGLTDASMDHSEPWIFLKLGKWLERIDRNVRCIQARQYQSSLTRSITEKNVISVVMLKSIGAIEAYRKVSPTKLERRPVLEFLLFRPRYPRSLRYCALQAAQLTQQMLRDKHASSATRGFGRLAARLEHSEIDEVITNGAESFLADVLRDTQSANAVLHNSYFLE
jgi:uncharacterized alpha-E superfamily protein